jgi:hypothetical protein
MVLKTGRKEKDYEEMDISFIDSGFVFSAVSSFSATYSIKPRGFD